MLYFEIQECDNACTTLVENDVEESLVRTSSMYLPRISLMYKKGQDKALDKDNDSSSGGSSRSAGGVRHAGTGRLVLGPVAPHALGLHLHWQYFVMLASAMHTNTCTLCSVFCVLLELYIYTYTYTFTYTYTYTYTYIYVYISPVLSLTRPSLSLLFLSPFSPSPPPLSLLSFSVFTDAASRRSESRAYSASPPCSCLLVWLYTHGWYAKSVNICAWHARTQSLAVLGSAASLQRRRSCLSATSGSCRPLSRRGSPHTLPPKCIMLIRTQVMVTWHSCRTAHACQCVCVIASATTVSSSTIAASCSWRLWLLSMCVFARQVAFMRLFMRLFRRLRVSMSCLMMTVWMHMSMNTILLVCVHVGCAMIYAAQRQCREQTPPRHR
jgi:hypothetical protein